VPESARNKKRRHFGGGFGVVDVASPAARDVATHCAHDHIFVTDNHAAERGTRLVMVITLVAMVVEIGAGWWFNSMALLADGWHMSSHAFAIGLSAFAYAMARRYATDPRFTFGTWKIEILGGFTSALFLLVVAAMMVFGSVERLLQPQQIGYREAMVVAILGLAVNIICALILGRAHGHHDDGRHGHFHNSHSDNAHANHGHAHTHHADLNLKAAYVHVITDAATSVLAIVALAGGWIYGWDWLDPAMGIVGAILVAVWAKNLLVDTAAILLDREMDHPVVAEIREVIADNTGGQARISDLHVWRVGRRAYACALSIHTPDADLTARQVRDWLAVHEEVVHVTIEIHQL
jgi:cation diffusion facilitator family transporter